MKKGKLIANNIICKINFEQNPSIYLEEKINEDGSKQLTDYQKWNPLKINMVSKFDYDLMVKYDYIFIIPDIDPVVWKLSKCLLNKDFSEIVFESCTLYQE
jgi:hypothetical protein